jgi:phosphoglycerate-specific signal transduction histidine kinase
MSQINEAAIRLTVKASNSEARAVGLQRELARQAEAHRQEMGRLLERVAEAESRHKAELSAAEARHKADGLLRAGAGEGVLPAAVPEHAAGPA